MSAHRNIDLIYLTGDTRDEWRKHYAKQTNLYPILDAFRDTRGPRWEVRFTNRRQEGRLSHQPCLQPRPLGLGRPNKRARSGSGKTSDWVGMLEQDTTHFSMVRFTGVGWAVRCGTAPRGWHRGDTQALG